MKLGAEIPLGRSAQIVRSLLSEGWQATTSFEASGRYWQFFRHPNGNKMVVKYFEGLFTYYKNGKKLKEERYDVRLQAVRPVRRKMH